MARKIIREIQVPSSNNGGASNNSVMNQCGKGRFLKRRDDNCKSGSWEEGNSEEVLIEKAAIAFRSVRKRISKYVVSSSRS